MPRGQDARHWRDLRTRPALLWVDLAMLAWTGGWIYVAVRVGLDVSALGSLPQTLRRAGLALASVGGAANALGHLPFIGHSLHGLGSRISATGRSTEATASASRHSISQLSILLPIVISLVPIVPVLLVYVPLRVQRWRESRSVLSVMRRGNELEAQRFLAHRAVSSLSFHRLEEVSADPWIDLQEGHYQPLANAELRRLGIVPRTSRRAS